MGTENPDAFKSTSGPFSQSVQYMYSRQSAAALFGALSLFLSAFDYLLPKPLPFMRLGLSNLPLLLALEIFSLKEYGLLVLIKTLGQALITGSFFSYVFLFSLSGSAVSACAMYGLRRIFGKGLSLAGLGIAGAFASNGVQLVLARFFIFGESARYLAPPFLALGIISGGALGLFAEAFISKSRWFAGFSAAPPAADFPVKGPSAAKTAPDPAGKPEKGAAASYLRLAGGMAAALLFTIIPLPGLKAALFVLFAGTAALMGKKIHPFGAILMASGIVLFNLFPPFGKVLFQAGPFIIAQGSLFSGIQKALQFEGLLMLSKIAGSGLSLPGSFGALIGKTFQILEALDKNKKRLFAAPEGKKAPSLTSRLDEFLLEISGQICYTKENG